VKVKLLTCRGRAGLVGVLALLAALGGLLLSPRARADQPARVLLSVSAVLAGKKAAPPADHDPAPAPLESLLRRAFPDHRAFWLLSTSTIEVALGKEGLIPLPNGATLQLGYQGLDGALIRLELSIPPRLKTSIRVNDGGTFFQAGMEYQSSVLILAITARCPTPQNGP